MRKKPSSRAVPNPEPYTVSTPFERSSAEHVVGVGLSRRQFDLGHRVERALRHHARNAGIAFIRSVVSSARSRSALRNADLMRSVAGQRGGDRVLHRAGTAQAAVGQFLDRRERRIEPRRRSDGHPSGTPAGREIRLRQARVGNDRRVVDRGPPSAAPGRRTPDRRRPRRRGSRGRAFRDLDQRRAASASRIDRAGRIVRIDHDERARLRA